MTEQQTAGSSSRETLAGRVMVVTGALSGTGVATARLAVQHGARLSPGLFTTDAESAVLVPERLRRREP
jgi:NAD(P)-dependent dehydrogenase (short-subunit alcohol dehydrogenase family)